MSGHVSLSHSIGFQRRPVPSSVAPSPPRPPSNSASATGEKKADVLPVTEVTELNQEDGHGKGGGRSDGDGEVLMEVEAEDEDEQSDGAVSQGGEGDGEGSEGEGDWMDELEKEVEGNVHGERGAVSSSSVPQVHESAGTESPSSTD